MTIKLYLYYGLDIVIVDKKVSNIDFLKSDVSLFKRSIFNFLRSSFLVSDALSLMESSPKCDVWTWGMYTRLYVAALVLLYDFDLTY